MTPDCVVQTDLPKVRPVAERGEWLAEFPLDAAQSVRFREVRPSDAPLVSEAIRTSSRETLLHRFFSPIRSVSPEQLHRMLEIDRAQGFCVVGVLESNGAQRIICGARYVRLPKRDRAEIAITVHDEFQHRGLGAFLLRLLTRVAIEDGVHWFEADVMASNRKMMNLLFKIAPHCTIRRIGDVNHVAFELLPENAAP